MQPIRPTPETMPRFRLLPPMLLCAAALSACAYGGAGVPY
jgi:hypothetical protein